MIQRGGRQAMTVAELVLALGLLGLLIISVLGFFTSLLASSTKGNDTALGAMLADRVLDRMDLIASQTYPAFSPTLNGSDAVYAQSSENRLEFIYSVTATELTPATNPLPTSQGQNWLLEVEVRWWKTDSAGSRVGSGQLFVRRARAVYIPK